MTDYAAAVEALKEVLEQQGTPHLGIGIAGERLVVRLKLHEYVEQLPFEVHGIPVTSSVVGQKQEEWPYGR